MTAGRAVFAADDGESGRELWAVPLSADGEPGPGPGPPPPPDGEPLVSEELPGFRVWVRIVGPKPNGRLWPTLVKFTTSTVEVWIEQTSTGDLEYYLLQGASPGVDTLPGLFDRDGFEP